MAWRTVATSRCWSTRSRIEGARGKSMTSRHCSHLVLIWAILATSAAARADDISWNNPVGGLWSIPGNWNPMSVPGSSDHAIIGLAGTYDVIATGSLSAGSVSITAIQPELW